MSTRRMFLVPANLVVLGASVLLTMPASSAGSASDECRSRPGASAPAGAHWYYRISRNDNRRCWYLAGQMTKARSHAADTASRAASPAPASPRRSAEAAPAMAAERAQPAAAASAQPAGGEAASIEAPRRQSPSGFASRWPDVSQLQRFSPGEPLAMTGKDEAAAEEQREWPVPAAIAAERASLGTFPAMAASTQPLFTGGLAVLLLLAGLLLQNASRRQRTHAGEDAHAAAAVPRGRSPSRGDPAPARAAAGLAAAARHAAPMLPPRGVAAPANDFSAGLLQLVRDLETARAARDPFRSLPRRTFEARSIAAGRASMHARPRSPCDADAPQMAAPKVRLRA